MEQASPQRDSAALSFLYQTLPGRILLRGCTSPIVSKIGGKYADSRLSKIHIKKFAKRNHIDFDDYVTTQYRSYNDFFTRQIRPELRPIDMDPNSFISPCDARLTAYPITKDAVFRIKGSHYTVEDLLGSQDLASHYKGGVCLVFRLCTTDYHRYCYLDSGTKGQNIYIKGKLHTVQPIALRNGPVFVQNCREYTVMDTENFGKVTEVEVGAMMVGRIENYHPEGRIRRGEEKGKFLFGGSTIVVLLEKNRVSLPEMLFHRTDDGIETLVRYGQKIGSAL